MGLVRGVRCFFDGFSTAFHPDNRHFVLLPGLVSLVVIGSGLGVGFSFVDDLSNYLVGQLPEWLSFLQKVLEPLLYVIGVLAGAWMFGFLAAIIGSPFLGELALRIDNPGEDDGLAWWQQVAPALLRELRKLRYHLPRLLLCVVCSLIPGINAFAPIVWFCFGSWMMAVQFCDFFHENRAIDFPTTLEVLRANRGTAFGFGACTAVAMAIPLVNFIAVPIAVVGGTLLMQRVARSS